MGDFNVLPAHLERPAFEVPREYRNRTLYQTDPARPGLWNGPYRVAAVETGTRLVLVRNEQWKGRRPASERIETRPIATTSALAATLRSAPIAMTAAHPGP